jgi:hypothetical protein
MRRVAMTVIALSLLTGCKQELTKDKVELLAGQSGRKKEWRC